MKRAQWKRFSFWVRWWYPRQEAQEILADYAEFPDPDLSHPAQIIRDLGLSRGCRSWLVVFCVLTVCLCLPAVWMFGPSHHDLLSCFLLLLGAVLSLIWFQRGEKGQFPKKMIPVLLLELALLCAAGGLMAGAVLTPQNFAGFGHRFSWFFLAIGLSGAVVCFWGLSQARIADRRWCAVYILGLTVLVLCICVLSMLHSMALTVDGAPFWYPYIRRAAWVSASGLVLTGVALC